MNRSCGARAFFGVVVAMLFGQLGCKDLPSDAVTAGGGGQGSGSLRLALTAATSVPIGSATYTLTGPGSYSKMGKLGATGGGALSGLVGGIPAGAGYDVKLDGVASDGSATCNGSALFDVMAHATTSVIVPLVCRETLTNGSASVTDTTNVCPVVDGVAADPTAAPGGGAVALTGAAHDKDGAPGPLAHHWTATAGTFDDATAPNPTFTCPASNATVTITLTVTDGGPGCSDSMSLTVTCG